MRLLKVTGWAMLAMPLLACHPAYMGPVQYETTSATVPAHRAAIANQAPTPLHFRDVGK